MMRTACLVGLVGTALALPGCAGSAHGSGDVPRAEPGRAGQTAPVAVLRDSLIHRDDLYTTLAEAAGAVALEEVVLDRLLVAEIAKNGITVGESEIEEERARLARVLGDEAGLAPDAAAEQVDRLRRMRGLGPHRFAALLARNAMLRALTQREAMPTPAMIDTEERVANGERFRLRVFTHPSQAVCDEVRRAITDGAPTLEVAGARFAGACVRQSTDGSSVRGGLMESISALDPGLPEAFQAALPTLAPGAVSPVLVTGQGFALVLVEDRAPVPNPVPREQIVQRLTDRLERFAMERYATRLLRESGLSVVDPSLGWSWESAGPVQDRGPGR